MISTVCLVEAPGVEGNRVQEISRNMAYLREHLGDPVLTRFRDNPRLLVQTVTYVAESLGAGGRADIHAVCVLLDEILARVEAEAGAEAG